MKVSLNWLKEFVELPADIGDVAERLTLAGLAVDFSETLDDDTVFELDVTTNRPDCLNHLGVARELSAIYGAILRLPQYEMKEAAPPAADVFSISISDPELCSRYCGRCIRDVRIGPSPDWMRRRLERVGVRSINNVADATNYVMLELGQPLHAFDARTLQGQCVIVRRGRNGENLRTLDGIDRSLSPSMLVIADANRPVALAGLMGGEETEISLNTTDVFLESAHFDPLSVRKTSRALGLVTEASYRFERGADIEMARFACDRAAVMIQSLAGGKIHRGLLDAYPVQRQPVRPGLRRSRIGAFLGAPVKDAAVETIFNKLGFKTDPVDGGWSVEVPSFRVDVGREEDLLEEVARHYGFDRFPATLPQWSGYGSGLPQKLEEQTLRNLLSGSGYSEIRTLSLASEDEERKFRPDTELERISNPLAQDASVLRASLIPSMLNAIQWNVNRGIRDLQFFELSKVYRKRRESWALILGAVGSLRKKDIHETDRDFNFYDLKGDVEDILGKFSFRLSANCDRLPGYFHPGRAARFGEVAVFGELHPDYAAKLRQRVYIAELDVDTILRFRTTQQATTIPRFPSIRRDFSLLLDRSIRFADLRAAIESVKIPEIARIEPFDRLERGPFPKSKYSLAVSVVYQSPERTLTDEEVQEFDQQILQQLESQLRAELRQ